MRSVSPQDRAEGSAWRLPMVVLCFCVSPLFVKHHGFIHRSLTRLVSVLFVLTRFACTASQVMYVKSTMGPVHQIFF